MDHMFKFIQGQDQECFDVRSTNLNIMLPTHFQDVTIKSNFFFKNTAGLHLLRMLSGLRNAPGYIVKMQ